MNDFFKKFITITRGSTDFFRSREVLPPPIREVDRPDAEHPGAEVDRSASTFADRCAGRSLESGDLGTGDDGTDSKSGSTSALGRVGTGTGTDSLVCPYCASKNYTKRGFRQKKLERVQLMICNDCGKTFTPHLVKGKHYPLATIFDAISLYNLGFSLEESCRRTASEVASVVAEARDNSSAVIPEYSSGIQKEETGSPVKLGMTGVSDAISGGTAPEGNGNVGIGATNSALGRVKPEDDGNGDKRTRDASKERSIRQLADETAGRDRGIRDDSNVGSISALGRIGTGTISASTLSNWIHEFSDRMPFLRMRDFAMQKYTPFNMVTTATLAHRQLYKFRFHHAKCELIMQENFHHKTFAPLKEFLELVNSECPHQYFSAKNDEVGIMRASELNTRVKSPLTFSKTAMIVRGKRNYATMMAEFVLQSVKDRTKRHEALQKYFLYNDSVTIATEVPVYLTRDDLEHMQTQLGFEVYRPAPDIARPLESGDLGTGDDGTGTGLPKLVTGHIDFLQIRNGMVHILDYKPKAEKEKPIEQLTLYAMALSRLTGLRLFEFKCAWFDEKDYFEFYPLHVLYKTKKAKRRKKVETQEGTYLVNKDDKKIKSLRPI